MDNLSSDMREMDESNLALLRAVTEAQEEDIMDHDKAEERMDLLSEPVPIPPTAEEKKAKFILRRDNAWVEMDSIVANTKETLRREAAFTKEELQVYETDLLRVNKLMDIGYAFGEQAIKAHPASAGV